MSSIALIDNYNKLQDLPAHLQLVVEQVRARSLDALLQNQPLSSALANAILQFESAIQVKRFAVYAISPDSGELSLLACPSLPTMLVQAIEARKILSAEDHVGQSFYTGTTGYVTHFLGSPQHSELKTYALHDGITSCFSFPINGGSGETLGALDIYCAREQHLEREMVVLSAAFASALGGIIERGFTSDKQRLVNHKLTERQDEQQRHLIDTHQMLTKALSQRDDVRKQLMEFEKVASMDTMVSSITHELTSPLGVSLTAVTHLKALHEKSKRAFETESLRRSQLEQFYEDSQEVCEIAERNLNRAAELIETFKQLSLDQRSEEHRLIKLTDFVCELLLSLKPELKLTSHKFCLDIDPDLSFYSLPGALGQVLFNLIMNSVKHAFEPSQNGRICISAKPSVSSQGQELELIYSDNGNGMDEHTLKNLYRPFFTQARHSGGTGLGMHICYNLAVNTLEGSIKCESALGQGSKFSLRIPI